MPVEDIQPYFFDEGIRFECVHCGQCCTGRPGVVRVTDDKIDAIAHHSGLSRDQFTVRDEPGMRLREEADGRCIFFDGHCTVHAVRPSQCRTYPFWYKNMRSEERWAQTCRECPGIGHGRLIAREEILQAIHESMASPSPSPAVELSGGKTLPH